MRKFPHLTALLTRRIRSSEFCCRASRNNCTPRTMWTRSARYYKRKSKLGGGIPGMWREGSYINSLDGTESYAIVVMMRINAAVISSHTPSFWRRRELEQNLSLKGKYRTHVAHVPQSLPWFQISGSLPLVYKAPRAPLETCWYFLLLKNAVSAKINKRSTNHKIQSGWP